ncbi:hypothetical protein ACFWUU_32120 [Kribbella sp. NPDC058693]|uniref:hypothetical protein n=1 Tax=Kribbella sp. NPDC058693 TaxID=3346602 RepID=UPI00364A92E4
MLHVFTERAGAMEYLESISPDGATVTLDEARTGSVAQAITAAPKNGVPSGGGYLDFYQYTDWGGCTWRMYEWEQHVNLRDLWACGFLWWGWISADDRASSLDAAYSADLVIFFDRPFPEAAFEDWSNPANALWIDMRALPNPYHLWIPNLHDLGWGDRISSQQSFYFGP